MLPLVVNPDVAEVLRDLGGIEGRDYVVSPWLPLDDDEGVVVEDLR